MLVVPTFPQTPHQLPRSHVPKEPTPRCHLPLGRAKRGVATPIPKSLVSSTLGSGQTSSRWTACLSAHGQLPWPVTRKASAGIVARVWTRARPAWWTERRVDGPHSGRREPNVCKPNPCFRRAPHLRVPQHGRCPLKESLHWHHGDWQMPDTCKQTPSTRTPVTAGCLRVPTA